MDVGATADGADRFVAYVEELASVIGHADRALPLRDFASVDTLFASGAILAQTQASRTAGGARIGLEPQLDHASRVLSITRNDGWINGNCRQCVECIDRAPPGWRLEIFAIHYEAVPLSAAKRS